MNCNVVDIFSKYILCSYVYLISIDVHHTNLLLKS
jgi:hypothetical protein